MIKYLIHIAYDGSNYYGFQRLNDLPTIQKELENSLKMVFKKEILIKGAGRTDKMVHAKDQCASFEAPFVINNKDLVKALNRHLPMDIRVTKCERKDDNFHARFNVKKKIYEYRINIGDYDPFKVNYYYQPTYVINLKRLKEISKIFVGKHDFNNFVSGEHSNTISIIFNIQIKKDKNTIIIKITGTNFYKYMVRNIVGAMLDYCKEKVSIADVKRMLDEPSIKHQLTTISPNGLYLTKIYY